ncbi:secreted Ly-6/uPAR-related protein 1 [Bombina bombina]|uniref:secreted Ly-6/uPAR-related protein 1 n=1 Tax=Bombina bombina TaxID=8345 RepID=UPI00235ACD26|nr:secreted Ly-6/uPAR-related protein 1 [Bombina bombina]
MGTAIYLVLGALSFDLAFCLQCYVCTSPTENRQCRDVQVCSQETKGCKTTSFSSESGYPFHGDETVVRECAKTCFPSNPDDLGADRTVHCCSADLCNNSGLFTGNSTSSASTNTFVTKSYRVLAFSSLIASILTFVINCRLF